MNSSTKFVAFNLSPEQGFDYSLHPLENFPINSVIRFKAWWGKWYEGKVIGSFCKKSRGYEWYDQRHIILEYHRLPWFSWLKSLVGLRVPQVAIKKKINVDSLIKWWKKDQAIIRIIKGLPRRRDGYGNPLEGFPKGTKVYVSCRGESFGAIVVNGKAGKPPEYIFDLSLRAASIMVQNEKTGEVSEIITEEIIGYVPWF